MSLCVHRFGIKCNRRDVLDGVRRLFGPSVSLYSNGCPTALVLRDLLPRQGKKMESTEGFLKKEVMT